MAIFAHVLLSLLVPTWIGTRKGQNTPVIFFFLASNFLPVSWPYQAACLRPGRAPATRGGGGGHAPISCCGCPTSLRRVPALPGQSVPAVAEVHGADAAAVERVVLAAGGKTPRRGRVPRPASTPHSYRTGRRHLPWSEAGRHGKGIREPRNENGARSGSSRGCEGQCRWGR
jgi:hypothetical protein